MKKTLQKVKCSVPANSTKQFSGQLRQDFNLCTGVFFLDSNYDTLTMRMMVAGHEIFPAGTNVALFDFNGNYPYKEAMYDLTKDMIPARSSEYQIDFANPTNEVMNVTVYFELANE